MALTPGSRLGSYQITAQIGAGGMGEVYSATDTKLKRQVAIKVLPESVAQDAERLARFQREAETLAALNHPGIAAIYGLEESDGVKALVMELVEGPTLADRIAQGPIPVDEALPIAKQIAEALEAAHEQGIVHRDLKPANIKLRPDGTVKVLDFGLAKAVEATAGASSSVSMSPTITTPAMTQAGLILGTAAYMSPEQAKGRPADRRSDVWAFGAVLFEMLTGARAFEGEDVTETLADVMRVEPAWDALPSGLSPTVTTFLKRSLRKDRRDRLGDIHDMRLALEGAFESAQASTASAAPLAAVPAWKRPPAVAAGAAVVAVLATLLAVWGGARPPAAPRVERYTIPSPDGDAIGVDAQNGTVRVSDDGSRLIFATGTGNVYRWYERSADELTPRQISVGEGQEFEPETFIFSPDGETVAFNELENDLLLRQPAQGGPRTTITRVEGGSVRGADWGPGGMIVYGTDFGGLWQVPAVGGASEQLLAPDDETEWARWPQWLSGERSVLFARAVGGARQLAVLDLETREVRVVLDEDASTPWYVATGHLLFGRDGAIWAAPFDLTRLEITGPTVPVVEGVAESVTSNTTHFSVGGDGTLAYVRGAPIEQQRRRLVWVDRTGRRTPAMEAVEAFVLPRLSPDGTRIAVGILEAGGPPVGIDIWLFDPERGTRVRLAADPAVDQNPLWTPDGERVVFSSSRAGGSSALYWVRADGSGAPEALTTASSNQGATSWSPDGRTLLFYETGNAAGMGGLYLLRPGETPTTLLEAPNAGGADYSPDGRWVAFHSSESGVSQVYITSADGDGSRIPVSAGGGRTPRWRADGRELFYRDGTRMMAVAVEPGPVLGLGVPQELFEADLVDTINIRAHSYDVTPDGERFLMIEDLGGATDADAPREQLVVVRNFFTELERLVPTN